MLAYHYMLLVRMWCICVASLRVPKSALMAHKTNASHYHATYLSATQSD